MPQYVRQGTIAGCLAYVVDAAGSMPLLIALMYLTSGVFIFGGALATITEVLRVWGRRKAMSEEQV